MIKPSKGVVYSLDLDINNGILIIYGVEAQVILHYHVPIQLNLPLFPMETMLVIQDMSMCKEKVWLEFYICYKHSNCSACDTVSVWYFAIGY